MRDFLDIINASAFSPNCKQTKMLLLKVYDYISLLTTDDSLHHWLMSFAGHRTPKKVKENWLTLAKQNMDMTFRILNDSGWSIEKKSGSDMIWSKYIPNFGKVLKFEGIIDNSVQTIKGKIIDDIENSPEWNSNLQEVRIVKQIDERTTITQSISKRYHAISSRDFVHLRSWTQIDNSIMLTCVSISHPDIPESSNAIRAEHKLFAYILHPVQNEPFKTHFICLMNVNLRGWLPQRIVDQTISMGMEDHIRDIRSSVKN